MKLFTTGTLVTMSATSLRSLLERVTFDASVHNRDAAAVRPIGGTDYHRVSAIRNVGDMLVMSVVDRIQCSQRGSLRVFSDIPFCKAEWPTHKTIFQSLQLIVDAEVIRNVTEFHTVGYWELKGNTGHSLVVDGPVSARIKFRDAEYRAASASPATVAEYFFSKARAAIHSKAAADQFDRASGWNEISNLVTCKKL